MSSLFFFCACAQYQFFILYYQTLRSLSSIINYYNMFVVVPFQLGWRYGSMTEDVLTGLSIHRRGWRSVYCTPDPPAFLGCGSDGGSSVMTQQKRWATGLLEILLSKNCPIFATLFGKLQLRQCLVYLYMFLWGLRSIPELCYATLPAYCIITNSSFLPKVR